MYSPNRRGSGIFARFLLMTMALITIAGVIPITPRAAIAAEPQPAQTLSATTNGDRVIVRFDDTPWPGAAGTLHQLGARAVQALPAWSGVYLATFDGAEQAQVAVDALRASPTVTWAEVDGVARYTAQPNDPLFSDQLWAQSVDLQSAWSVTRGRPGIIVAVVDSGVSRSHPDLDGQLLQGHDFLNGDNEPEDDIGHGTAVAGIIAAASDDQIGIAGVAGAARVLPVKVGSIDGAPISVLAQGIIWSVDQGADVINLSLVTEQTSLALQDALLYAYQHGVPVIAAAGNEQDAVTYPGAYEQSISVGASTFWGSVADFSTRQNRVDLIAPGTAVLAPWWSAADGNTWTSVSGTSFAAPIVSGTVALLLSVNPELSIEEIRELLRAAALPVSGDTPVPGAGAGQLDAGATLRALLDQSLTATWATADQPVAEALVGRTWLWGPDTVASGFEPYADSPEDERLVRYYDKARMEVTDPLDDRDAPWYVTNGLIAQEMISGQMQVGDSAFAYRGSAQIAVAGDPGDPLAPTYSDLRGVLGTEAAADNALLVQTLDGAGRTGSDQRYAQFGVFAAEYVPETGHQIASVFWDYLRSDGLIYRNGELVNGQLFDPVFFATGFPITEAYWTRVLVAGERVDVLIQCFERRCLTYTPTNAPEWRVEMSNAGLHYFRWRYEDGGELPPRGGAFREQGRGIKD